MVPGKGVGGFSILLFSFTIILTRTRTGTGSDQVQVQSMKTVQSSKGPITIDEFCGSPPGTFKAMLEQDRVEAEFKLLRAPMKDGQCPECADVHEPEMPHNQQSLFWQYNFMEKNGRWPTWADALAHCSPEMRAQWVTALAEHGVIVPNIS